MELGMEPGVGEKSYLFLRKEGNTLKLSTCQVMEKT
jgi:hypothetical protein